MIHGVNLTLESLLEYSLPKSNLLEFAEDWQSC